MSRFFKDLSIRSKLFLGFGLVLTLTAVLGLVTLNQMSKVNSGGAFVGTNSLPAVEEIGRIQSDVIDYRRAHLRFILETSPAVRAVQRTKWLADDADVAAELKA